MIKNNAIFIDDLSVTKGNYFIALVKAIIISLTLLYLLFQSENHPIICSTLTLTIVIFLKYFGFNIFNLNKLKFIHFVYILGGYILMYLLDTIYLHFYPLPTNEELLENSTNSLPIWISIVSIAIIPAIIEEIIFRIFILRVVFRNHLLIGLIVSSLAFAAVHDSDTLIGYLPYFLSGLIFGFAYLKTRRIEVPILIHFLNNFFVSISSILS